MSGVIAPPLVETVVLVPVGVGLLCAATLAEMAKMEAISDLEYIFLFCFLSV